MSPPLVAFSIKTPSRLADALVSASPSPSSSDSQAAAARTQSSQPLPPAARAAEKQATRPHFVVNLLGQDQANLARAFATPGIEPFPYGRGASSPDKFGTGDTAAQQPRRTTSPRGRAPHPFDSHDIFPCHEADGIPVVRGSLGALSCSLVADIPLAQLSVGSSQEGEFVDQSVLFIARIHSVIDKPTEAQEQKLPLVYWDRRFTTVKDGQGQE
ncbi:uncharacterized protein PSFLO_03098 [Pseudozyma flocculosa]|uniref:Flavin reductase like domain-containing protein n=2 Tax=Pseudozyma flocculosa TaxID=84751 RepID=A0A5C3EZB8_9BASI|nr:uncharacterized protein PSFLO_03098 [Pseudozyma flocculosa]